MFRITVETPKNSRIQNISEEQVKRFLSPRLMKMLQDKFIRSVALSKSNSVMYVFTYENNA